MQLFLLLILTLAVCTTAQNCLSQIKCSAECAPYRADKPRPRIYQSCLAGCNGGLKGSCSVCNKMPKPHPRTNKICSKACKNSGSQLRKCEKTKAKDEQVKREQSETQQAPTESVERRLETETELIETAATNAVPSADMEAKIKAVADAARVEQKALDDQTIANAVAAAAKDAAIAAAAKLQEETSKSVESAKIAAEAQKVAAEEAVKAEAQALAAAQVAQDAAEAEALAEAEAGK